MLSRKPSDSAQWPDLDDLRLLLAWCLGALYRAPLFYGLALLAACLMSGLLLFDFSPRGFNARRVALVLSGLAVCLALCLSGRYRQSFRRQIQQIHPGCRWGLLAVFLLGLLSALQADYPEKGLQEVGLHLLLLIMTLAVSVSALNERSITVLLWLCAGGLLSYCSGYLFYYALYLNYPPDYWSYSLYNYASPRNFNHIQGWLIPLAVLLPLASQHALGLVRKLSCLPLAALYFFMLVSGGRGLPLALAGAWVMSYLLFRQYTGRQLVLHIKTFMLGAAVYLVFIQAIPIMLGQGYEHDNLVHRLIFHDDAGRLAIWQLALQASLEHPWWGLGPQHYITLDTVFPSPHNVFLLWLSEWGLPAAALMTGLCLWTVLAFVSGVRRKLSNSQPGLLENHLQVALCTSLMTSCLYAQVSGVYLTPLSQLFMVLVVGCCVHFHFRQRSTGYPLTALERFSWLLLAGFLLLAFFWIFYREFALSQYLISLPMEPNSPRFWRNGDFFN
ncbi:MAG: O-antigen ligase family protein [Endozoicomonas sp.]